MVFSTNREYAIAIAKGMLTATAKRYPPMISTEVIQAPLITVLCRLLNSDQILLGGGNKYSLIPKSFTVNSQIKKMATNIASTPSQRRINRWDKEKEL